jgi:hypothetical protein
VLLMAAAALLTGCDAIPRDSAGALDRARGGELRVGLADHPPWVRFDGEGHSGLEPELIEAWAKKLGARIHWRRGAEAELVEAVHRRELDVLVAGLDNSTPYRSRLGLSQPYLEYKDRYGSTKKRVIAVTPGESALLLSLDRFLAVQDPSELLRRVREQERAGARP